SNFANIIAVADVDAQHAEAASKQFGGATIYSDFRKLLARDDLHAIINGTPDHWHMLVNLAALKAGKDVYSEKPLTLTIDESNRSMSQRRRKSTPREMRALQRESDFSQRDFREHSLTRPAAKKSWVRPSANSLRTFSGRSHK